MKLHANLYEKSVSDVVLILTAYGSWHLT